ncbi:MAG: ribonuclease J [Candidatus Saganbacteria bacterium]|nr:ribonuclease J [Candidatus Saganbacteria bacterium]
MFKNFGKKHLEIIHLGGLAEIGKNMTAFKFGNNIILVDCGIKFPDDDMHGIDFILPDFDFVKNNKNLIRALFLTHGHEDHIGAIPHLLREINVPIYGTRLTLGLLEDKLKESKQLKTAKLNVVKPRDVINMGPFKVEFLRVCHSIPDSTALAIKTPVGTVLHTGDFKIDHTPIDGQQLDLVRFGELGKEGVLLLMSDSTNADTAGSTPSEKTVGKTFEKVFNEAPGRIIVATFASSIHRVQQVIDAAARHGRKVAISGFSMQRVANKAKELGYLKVPKDMLVKLDDIHKANHKNLVILTTGSQGEPMAALSRMAKGEHKQVKIQKGDTVVISAIPIPGNEKSVYNTINKLFRFGAEVIYEERHGIHVSGHGCQEEMKLIINLVRPQFFIPVHGEYRHMVAHAKIARESGIAPENIFINENGDILRLSRNKASRAGRIEIKEMLVDSTGAGGEGSQVLSDRRQLAENGVVIVNLIASKTDFRKITDIRIETKGFVFSKTHDEVIKRSKEMIDAAMRRHYKSRFRNIGSIRQEIQKELQKYYRKKINRLPVVIVMAEQV